MNTNTIKETKIGLELTRKLLLLDHSQSQQDEEGRSTRTTTTPRFTHEALQAASFLLERFVSEARQRAKLEAEFEYDKGQYHNSNINSNNNTSSSSATTSARITMAMNPTGETKDGSKRLNFNNSQNSSMEDSMLELDYPMEIQAEHVLKIAAELLLDFC